MSAMSPLMYCYCGALVDSSAEYNNLATFSLPKQISLADKHDFIIGSEGCVFRIELTKEQEVLYKFPDVVTP